MPPDTVASRRVHQIAPPELVTHCEEIGTRLAGAAVDRVARRTRQTLSVREETGTARGVTRTGQRMTAEVVQPRDPG